MKKQVELIYDVENLLIKQKGFSEKITAKTESIFAQGNGYLGLRAVDEEFSSTNKEDFFIAGFYNQGDNKEVSELANLADLLQTSIYIDGERFKLSTEDFYEKKIDLKSGMLTRRLEFVRNKKFFRFIFKRIVSQKNRHVYGQRIVLEQLSSGITNIQIFPRINGQTTNQGIQHLTEGFKKLYDSTAIQYFEQTSQTKHFVGHNMQIHAFNNKAKLQSGTDDFVIQMERRRIGFKISFKLYATKKFELEKIMSVNTTRDHFDISQEQHIKDSNKIMPILKNTRFKDLLAESKKEFKQIYNQFPVKIKGDSYDAKYDMLSFYFAIFHQNTFVPKNVDWISVGSKGLSGEGYQGHCYWDTEFYVVPNFIFNIPDTARNLLTYRYKGIEGARRKAQEGNYIGAQFPWEMAAPEDGEVTPYWGQPNIKTGEQIPIASRHQEIHVPGDIAFSVNQYYQITEDWDFMKKFGIEMIIDTAIFWGSRAEWKKEKQIFEINNVMGPNEYKGNINNNAFTNMIAKRNIELAFKYFKKLNKTLEGRILLEKINKKISYQYDWTHLRNVHDKLIQQKPDKNKIISENDSFTKLPIFDLKDFRLLGDAGKKLFNTSEGNKKLLGQIIKQADVVLLTYLFAEKYSLETIKKNFEYYEAKTTHDSSLSPITYTIQAIELRKMDLAYELFKYSINIDMGSNFHSSDKGIHAGALSAIYQSIVFGYGGLKFIDSKLHINPIVPKQWKALKYSIIYKRTRIFVIANKNKFSVFTERGKTAEVYINNNFETIDEARKSFAIKKTLAKGIVFDFEGSIIEYEKLNYIAWSKSLEKHNLNLNIDPKLNIRDLNDNEIFKCLIKNENIKINDAQKASITRSKNIFLDESLLEKNDELFIEPEMKKIIQTFKKQKFKLVVISKTNHVNKILNSLKLSKYFDFIIDKKEIEQIPSILNLYPCEIIGIDSSYQGTKKFKQLGFHSIGIIDGKEASWKESCDVTFSSKKIISFEKIIQSTHLNSHKENIDYSNKK